MKGLSKTLLHGCIGLASAGLYGWAGAQQAAASGVLAPPQTTAPAATQGARFIEACTESLERGVAALGCQGPIYRNELERLQREALSTQNPQLLSFVGDAYGNPRSGLGDMGQAYRWYLLAAVRGDARAMQRLAEMNRKGQGAPKDNVKALGYARLLERMAQPGSAAQRNVLTVINELGAEMAVEEVALAERFAQELAAHIQQQTAGTSPIPGGVAPSAAEPVRPGAGLPGMAALPHAQPEPAAVPGSVVPGMPRQEAP